MKRRQFIRRIGSLAAGSLLAPASMALANEELARTPVIKVFGIGGAGSNIVNRLIASDIGPFDSYVCINTDKSILEHSHATTKIVLGTGEPLTGQPPGNSEKLAFAQRDLIMKTIDGADIVVVIAGLGGNAGTGIAPLVANFGRRSGALVFALVTTPFSFEGINRNLAADKGIVMTQINAHYTTAISNAAIGDSLDDDTSIRDAFRASDDAVGHHLKFVLGSLNQNWHFQR